MFNGPRAIALQELINVCYQYSNEIALNFNDSKSFCVAFTPKHYKLLLPYCRSNRLVRLFNKCSKPTLLELCRSFCTAFYCPHV